MSPKKAHAYQLGREGGDEILVDAVDHLRTKLALRGSTGIIGLGRAFKTMDKDHKGYLSFDEFRKTLLDYRIELDEIEIDRMYDFFDRDHNGKLSYEEFLRGIRGPLNAFRRSLVLQVFDKLDVDRSGMIETNDIKGFYDASLHPEVKKGKKSEEEVLTIFLQTFETYLGNNSIVDAKITQDEFLDYYTFISSSIDNDAYFELMMQNAWGLKKRVVRAKTKRAKQDAEYEQK